MKNIDNKCFMELRLGSEYPENWDYKKLYVVFNDNNYCGHFLAYNDTEAKEIFRNKSKLEKAIRVL